MIYLKRFILCGSVLFLFLLASCGGSPDSNNSGNVSGGSTPTSAATQGSTAVTVPVLPTYAPTNTTGATPVSSTSSGSGSNNKGPIVILSPTPLPGGGSHSQLITLADRTLAINSVSQQNGSAGSTNITLNMTITNTGSKAIDNQLTYFQLYGAEGDSFSGSSTTQQFFGTIALHSVRTGTIVFPVPSAALSGGFKLLYRSDVPTEAVFVPIKLS